jgi:hypothetical protein
VPVDIGDRHGDIHPGSISRVCAQFGEHSVRQARRMITQQLRLREMDKILTMDTGIDLATNREIFSQPRVFEAEDYVRALRHITYVVAFGSLWLSSGATSWVIPG